MPGARRGNPVAAPSGPRALSFDQRLAAGLFVLWRERQLGLKRAREAEGPPSGA